MRPARNQPQQARTLFKQLRLKRSLSQEALAKEIGVAVSTIRRWDKGQAEPHMTLEQFKRYCRAVATDFEGLPEKLGLSE